MKNIAKFLMFSVFFSALFTSCVEDDGWDELKGEGPSLIKFLEGPEKANYFSPFTNTVSLNAFTLRRDASNGGELQKTTTIKLKNDPSIIANYNEEHGDTYEQLPSDFYTVTNPDFQKTTSGYDIVLKGGDFSKEFTIALDGSKWIDLSKKYAIALRVEDAPGLIGKAGQDSIMIRFAIKNRWDGIYEVTKGSMTDVVSPTLTHVNNALAAEGEGLMQFTLETLTETKCLVVDNFVIGGPYVPISSGDALSYYGSFGLVLEFDPATDKIIGITNYWGQPAANTRSARLDPSGVNQYDRASKTINLTYNMLQSSSVPTPPHIRTTWVEEWTFLKERE